MLAERKKQLKITVSLVTATILAAIAFVSLGQLSQAPNNIRSATNQKKNTKKQSFRLSERDDCRRKNFGGVK